MKIYETEDFGLDEESLKLGETIFHNANGYLGVRGCLEEGSPESFDTVRGTYLNGFYDFVPMPQAEKLYGLTEEKQTIVNIMDTQGIELWVDGEKFSMFEGEILARKRWLDMEKGITVREVRWKSPSGKIVEIQISRMCSFVELPLFLITYSVKTVNFSGELVLRSTHCGQVMNYFNPNDPRVAGECHQHMLPGAARLHGGISVITSKTARSGLSVTGAVGHTFSREGKIRQETKESSASLIYTVHIGKQETLTMQKYSVFCDSIRYPQPKESALAIVKKVLAKGAAKLYEEQEAFLARFWENCGLEIQGEPELSEAIAYNMYQLIQSAGKDPHCSVAAKGLSGEGYEGHYFWDTEMYLQPFYVLNARDISENLLRYRYITLEEAKKNAKLLGHKKGAAYPWRTIMGKECSGFFPSGSAAYHINGDIAYAIAAYYLATKDTEMLKEYGCEILLETARLWMDIGCWQEETFRIHTVTGPDEYTCLVNNNYYTNVVAAYNLKWAVKSFRILEKEGKETDVQRKTGISEEELAEFTKASEGMYLPYDEKLGINPQDDSFLQKEICDVQAIREEEKPLLLHYHPMYLYRYQICKQADTVMAHCILEEAQDEETIRRSFAYYERITTHDSSLSTCIFSIVAARLGMMDKAYGYLGESAKLDLFDLHHNTKDGIHTANMGGTYMAVVYGFGGLRIKEDGLHLSPRIPKQWKGYSFRFQYEDVQIQVKVWQGGCQAELLRGEEKELILHGQRALLRKGKPLRRENTVI